MRKESCVISSGVWEDSRCLLKNRDRNYNPNLRVVHTSIDGVEVAYLEDLGTGWIEGLNEFGIGIVNSALMVGRDEAEKKLVKTRGKKSKDGERVLKALSQRTLKEALKSLQTFRGGVKGHTILSDSKSGWSLEMTSKHECVTKRLPGDKIHVRTNHGFEYEDAGYTEGSDYISSVTRQEEAAKALARVDRISDLAPALMKARKKDRSHPNNIVRDTDNMYTSSQMVVDLENLRLLLYLIKGKQTFKSVEIKGRPKNPKIRVEIFDYDEGASVKKRASRIMMARKVLDTYLKR